MFFKYLANYYLLNMLSDIIPHPKLRATYLRLLGATIGKNVRIERVTFFQVQHSIRNLHCADNVHIGTGVILDLSEKITIGEFVGIGPGCTILTHQNFGEYHGNILSSIYKTKYQPVNLGKHVIIGADTTILAGANIGSCSLVGAKSLVIGDIPANVLAVGAPAKIVREHGSLLPLEGKLREARTF